MGMIWDPTRWPGSSLMGAHFGEWQKKMAGFISQYDNSLSWFMQQRLSVIMIRGGIQSDCAQVPLSEM